MSRISLLLLLTSLGFSCSAQVFKPVFQGEAQKNLRLLYLSTDAKVTFHDLGGKSLISLYSQDNNLEDQLEIFEDIRLVEEIILLNLGQGRFFLQTENYSYNFKADSSRIVIEEKRPVPDGPKGTVKRVFFFDGQESITVFLNELEQYNVYIDSAGRQIKKEEKFYKSHLGNVKQFKQRPIDTPIVTYSQFSKELFFHLPTDISFLSVNLKERKIDIGLILIEYQQKYTFRRYFDQLIDQRYVLKEDVGDELSLFKVSSFDVLTFSNEYGSEVKKWPVTFTPTAIVDGKILLEQMLNRSGKYFYKFYLVAIEDAINKQKMKSITR